MNDDKIKELFAKFDPACSGRTRSDRPNLANVRPPEDK